ncbi:MAG: macro domain-containing protein [Gammaproteobacteria bacterium]|nr:macro domain-containing protein [Gammaproteobacteria bacterium]
MIRFTSGDIIRDEADALVNTVNCVGVMGRGIALQFKKAFPDNFEEYRKACHRGEVLPGRMFITERDTLAGPRFIVNFPTKRHWRGKSRIEDIESGLEALGHEIRERDIKSIAIPALGSGLGGLNWSEVKSRIVAALENVDVAVCIYEPGEAPAVETMVKTARPPTMTRGRAALVALIHRYLAGLLDPFVTLIEVHKLMYFMQEEGEPLRLNYRKRHYGPYADNLRHVLNAIEGYFVVGYADGGDYPNRQIELVPGAIKESEKLLLQHKDTHARFERVSHLIDGFESPVGMELLATVHWLVKYEDVVDAHQSVEAAYAWNDRKKRFTPRQICLAFDRLAECGWC